MILIVGFQGFFWNTRQNVFKFGDKRYPYFWFEDFVSVVMQQAEWAKKELELYL